MKKLLLVALVCSMIAVAAQATDTVRSRNAVGYVRVEVDAQKMYLMCVNFESMTGQGYVEDYIDPIDSGLPGGTTIYFWDPVEQEYKGQVDLYPGHGWHPAETPLDLGQSFWLAVGGTAGNSYTFYVMGEVPTEDLALPLMQGMNFAAYSFPVRTQIEDLKLPDGMAGGSTVYYYDPDLGWGQEDWYPGPRQWYPGEAEFMPGQGLLIYSQGADPIDWLQEKPWSDWP